MVKIDFVRQQQSISWTIIRSRKNQDFAPKQTTSKNSRAKNKGHLIVTKKTLI